ncbi:MAG: ABC transporter substrate-binding protein [Alphaproteobacteria bacterium]|nr:ABC transporter substrate-binding protein [Alphaproteobacteria bacterium]
MLWGGGIEMLTAYVRQPARRFLLSAAVIIVAGLVAGAASAQSLPTLGTVSFPGPAMSAQPVPIIKGLKLDEKNGWNLDWNIRTTAAAYLNDYYTNVYSALHVSGVNYLAANYNKGAPIRIIGGTLVFPYAVMALADGPVKSIADLKGKSLGSPKASYIHAYVVALLKAAKLDPDKDLKIDNIDILQAAALLERGDYDAALVPAEYAVRLDAQAPGKYKPISFPDKDVAKLLGVDEMYLVFTVHADWLKQNPGKIKGLLATMTEVQKFIDANPAEAQKLLAPRTDNSGGKGTGGANLDAVIFKAMYQDGYYGRKMKWVGIPVKDLKAQLKKEFELYKDIGMIDKVPDDGIFFEE